MHAEEEQRLAELLRRSDASAKRTRQLILWVSVATAALVALCGRWITRRITTPAQRVTAAAQRVVEGDLSRRAAGDRAAGAGPDGPRGERLDDRDGRPPATRRWPPPPPSRPSWPP